MLNSYVIHTLDELVADDYMIVYFHGATPRRQMPSFTWLKRCYQGIDRRWVRDFLRVRRGRWRFVKNYYRIQTMYISANSRISAKAKKKRGEKEEKKEEQFLL